MENYLDLRQILGIIRKHIIFIMISFILCLIIAVGLEKFVITPQFTSTAQILVNQKKDTSVPGAAFQDQQADVQMISTYKDIITNQFVLKTASERLANPVKVIHSARRARYRVSANGHRHLIKASRPAVVKSTGTPYDVSVKQLQGAISVTNQQNSQVFALNVESDDPQKSAAIANTVAKVFKQKIRRIMSINNVTIVSEATPVKQKSFPKTSIVLLVGAVVGLLVGLGYAFIREMTDTTIKDDEFLTNELNLTNLGHIAEIRKIRGSRFADERHGEHLKSKHRRV
ncbi:YveK family protein [Lentilactobacillus parabuchneri]|uniref:YveK family protein n=1 Tax=Lentilactobacillus parabuchneri TaxID=152331 RepID=UPI000A0FA4D9|nr:Wzz/FepE/Etk N-terminal domain-containing protein [Lentilactobacillus parabuchneri]ORN30805.1 Capsular polysaccharide type 8 biosynthesis protein cap8A [Lentilactobacillus parabuchneri]ORN30872.1 Capsular polysaccharide type 8 biosynthesis protein cap8A [Lentilactobacillus parabuchneri]ORN33768.1 Capsular polysaccharide type 8 biosynthesis protein cap8A [Lentilactobacillus parabuchneri]